MIIKRCKESTMAYLEDYKKNYNISDMSEKFMEHYIHNLETNDIYEIYPVLTEEFLNHYSNNLEVYEFFKIYPFIEPIYYCMCDECSKNFFKDLKVMLNARKDNAGKFLGQYDTNIEVYEFFNTYPLVGTAYYCMSVEDGRKFLEEIRELLYAKKDN